MTKIEENAYEELIDPDYQNNTQDNNLYTTQGMNPWSAPVDSMDRLNDKIISSYNKNREFVIKKPVIKELRVALPLLDKDKKIIRDKNGNPIIKKVVTTPLLIGFKKKTLQFPIQNWFNDSRTSAILEKKEGQVLREADDLAYALYTEMLLNPKIDHSELIGWLDWITASIIDTSKGIGGAAVVNAKTTISKGESIVQEYRKDPTIEREQELKKRKGIFGLGWLGGLL